MKEAIRSTIDTMHDDLISTIRELVAVKSVGGEPAEENAPFGPGPKAALDKFIEIADRMGFSTGVFDNQVGWAEYGRLDDEMVGILAHVDVVPEGEGWSCDPFEGKIEEGFLYGRGVADDKGPAVCSLFALKALRDCGVELKRRVRVIVGTNEEMGSRAIKNYVEAGQELPVAGFTPDGSYPLINGEKGSITAMLRASFAPTGDVKIMTLDAGVAANSVPEKAIAELEVAPEKHAMVRRAVADWVAPRDASLKLEELGDNRFRLTMTGLSSHGSRPQNGSNAAAHLTRLLRLLNISGPQGALLEQLDRLIGTECMGESLGLCRYDDIAGFSSLCWGIFRKEGDSALFSWNYRFPVTMDLEELETQYRAVVRREGFEVENWRVDKALYVPEDAPLVINLMEAYREETGRLDDKPFAIGGGTYAKAMPNVLAFGVCFPEENQHIHEIDERWEIDKIVLTTKIIAAAIIKLANA